MTYKWLSYYTINTYKAPCELNFVLPSIYMLKPWYPVLQNVTLLGNRILANLSLPGGASDKESTCQHRKCKRCQFDPWVGKILWRRKWQPAPIFLPGKFHGQKSLVGYSPWSRKRVRHKWALIILQTYLGALWWPKGVGWWKRREAQEGGDTCIIMADSSSCMAETNMVKNKLEK